MKKLLTLLSLVLCSQQIFAAISIEGTYQGKNLYVQNPEDEDGFGFCATKVTVNGDVMPGGTSIAAFEIDFSMFSIEIGEPVFIVIEHNDGCKPKILNAEVLLPKSTFKVTEMTISMSGKLVWKTTGESGKLPYVIEQYRWNKWVTVGEVDGKGSSGANAYEYVVAPHSGENQIRVSQIDHSGAKRSSQDVKFDPKMASVEKNPVKVKTAINFTSGGKPVETRYEIFDAYGNIVKKGVGSSVDCSNLKQGAYYINFDNKMEKFIRG